MHIVALEDDFLFFSLENIFKNVCWFFRQQTMGCGPEPSIAFKLPPKSVSAAGETQGQFLFFFVLFFCCFFFVFLFVVFFLFFFLFFFCPLIYHSLCLSIRLTTFRQTLNLDPFWANYKTGRPASCSVLLFSSFFSSLGMLLSWVL